MKSFGTLGEYGRSLAQGAELQQKHGTSCRAQEKAMG
jgi:hypothetical protein